MEDVPPKKSEANRQLAEVIAVHGAKRWKTIAIQAGLNMCGKSCRLRWMNYLPKLILMMEQACTYHGFLLFPIRVSLIAARTNNEIKNYWNSHLSKKVNQKEEQKWSFTAAKLKRYQWRRPKNK